MAMAVAVKNSSETSSGLAGRLPVVSLFGVLYVLAGLAAVFWLVPDLWQSAVSPGLTRAAGSFVDAALLLLVILGVVVGFGYVGLRLLGPQPQPGIKAGIFFGLIALGIIGLLVKWASLWIEHWVFTGHLFGSAGPTVGAIGAALILVVLVVLVVRFALKPGVEQWLSAVEEQGWFSTTAYKRSQGLRVRRGTIVGLLVLAGAGIFTLVNSKRLDAGPGAWTVNIPFTGRVTLEAINDAGPVLEARNLPGEPGQAVDRYALRDANDALVADYVRITEPGLKFEQGQLVSKKDYDEAIRPQQERIDELENRIRKLKAEGQTFAARDLESEAEQIRLSLPATEPPTPAAGKTSFASLTLLPSVQLTLPLLLIAGSIWLAWRIVNVPVFADFLIATEAEMNKVSWTTRRRLAQDTVVVLVTVVLMTVFLLVADIFWSKSLSWIGVLRVGDGSGESAKDGPKKNERPW
jgi:preprotein translocase SecE subunit